MLYSMRAFTQLFTQLFTQSLYLRISLAMKLRRNSNFRSKPFMASHKALPSRSPCSSNGKEDSSIIVRSVILYAMRKGLMVISFFFRRSAGKSCDWHEQCKGDGASSLGGCNDQPGLKGLHVARSYCQSLNKINLLLAYYWSREILVVASNYLMVIV